MQTAALFARHATQADLNAIQRLLNKQAARRHQRDARLPAHEVLPEWVIFYQPGMTWLLEAGGRLVAVCGAHREFWPEDNAFANVFPRQYLRLGLHAFDASYARPVLAMLLNRAATWASGWHLSGSMMMLPVCEYEMVEALRDAGFSPYHALAQRPRLPEPALDTPAGVLVRQATSADTAAVGALMAQSWQFHARHQPAIRLTSDLHGGCEQKAAELLGDGDGTALLVAEQDREVIGFYGITLNWQAPNVRRAYWDKGLYGDILEVAVREDWRRRGVGAVMFRAAWYWFMAREVNGLFVNYAPTNPTSSRYWPKLGFADGWVNWWRA